MEEKEPVVEIEKSLVLRSMVNNISLCLVFLFQALLYFYVGASSFVAGVTLMISYFPARDAVSLWEAYRKKV